MKKIILLLQNLTCQHDIDKRKPEELIKKGYNVSIWSLGYLVFGQKAKVLREGKGNIVIIYTKKELCQLIKENTEAVFIDYLGGEYSVATWIRAQLARNKCQYYCVYNGAVPVYVEENSSNCNTLRKLIKEKGVWGYGKYFCHKRLKRIGQRMDLKKIENCLPKALFLSAKADLRSVPKVFCNVPVFYTHSYDYEEYLKSGIENRIIEEKYILFVDTAVTNHPEYIYRGDHVFETQEVIEEYYKNMCHFFDVVEEKYKLKVVVAAHPRSHFKGDEFQGREIILGESQSLIAGAERIFTGPSMSIAFMALYQKPFALISTEELKNVPQLRNFRKAMENFFQTKCIWVEQIDHMKWTDCFVTDRELFAKYTDSFTIEKGVDPEAGMWDIMLNVIEGRV